MSPDTPPPPSRSLLLCVTPRTGSYLLCEGLINTGVAGRPTEYFATSYWAYWAERWGTHDYPAYLERVRQAGTTPNGVFACKAHPYQLRNFVRQVLGRGNATAVECAAAVRVWFPKPRYVWLRRRDRLRQAISYARGLQTDVWWDTDEAPAPLHGTPKLDALQFDAGLITDALERIAESDGMLEEFFRDAAIEPLVMYYEDLVADYAAQVRLVTGHVGVELHDSYRFPPSKFRRQSDDLTEQWVDLYRAHAQLQGV